MCLYSFALSENLHYLRQDATGTEMSADRFFTLCCRVIGSKIKHDFEKDIKILYLNIEGHGLSFQKFRVRV